MLLQVSDTISFNEFLNLVASELLVKDQTLTEDTKFRNLHCWSSLNALLLIAKLNEFYCIFISSADLATLITLQDFYHLITDKLNGNMQINRV